MFKSCSAQVELKPNFFERPSWLRFHIISSQSLVMDESCHRFRFWCILKAGESKLPRGFWNRAVKKPRGEVWPKWREYGDHWYHFYRTEKITFYR